ncbi:terminase small subunit [Bradyrhizobium sp. BWA-3-5]
MALTAKQQRFIQEFLLDLNATQAAIRNRPVRLSITHNFDHSD